MAWPWLYKNDQQNKMVLYKILDEYLDMNMNGSTSKYLLDGINTNFVILNIHDKQVNSQSLIWFQEKNN
jgi:hypothetical protein